MFTTEFTQQPGQADRKRVTQIMYRISHNGGTIGEYTANKFNNGKTEIEEKNDRNAIAADIMMVVSI